ncbi:GspH/FimT family protein [Hydrogenophaga sp.]|uniref:GspH/FimT family protein n=1 Tax=Hydrogenophaga sp. TaxID=1904254 RepID=UPI0034200425
MLSNQFLSDLAGARSEAIKRGTRVVLRKASNGTFCVSSGGNQGWLVFEDQNNNGARDATERLVSQLGAQPAGWTIRGAFTGAHFVSYHPSGRTMLPSGALQAGTQTICRASHSPHRWRAGCHYQCRKAAHAAYPANAVRLGALF